LLNCWRTKTGGKHLTFAGTGKTRREMCHVKLIKWGPCYSQEVSERKDSSMKGKEDAVAVCKKSKIPFNLSDDKHELLV
jgi:hypothetical protein